MAIGFLEVNNHFKEIKGLGSVINLIIGFEMFLQKFNNYQDIDTYF